MLAADALRAWVCGGTEEGRDTASKGTRAGLPASKEHLTAHVKSAQCRKSARALQFERDHLMASPWRLSRMRFHSLDFMTKDSRPKFHARPVTWSGLPFLHHQSLDEDCCHGKGKAARKCCDVDTSR